jgi:hypothetical protein
MRTSFRIMATGAAATLGFLAFGASPTIASAAAAAPLCFEYTTYVACNAAPGGSSPWTWTVRIFNDGIYGDPTSYSTTVPTTKVYCAHDTAYSITSSYVAGGVTYTSSPADIQCNGSGNE